jgi:hypothetical protein
MRCELCDCLRVAVLGEVCGARAQHDGACVELARDIPGIVELSTANGDVVAFADKINSAICRLDRQLHRGKAASQFWKHRGHPVPTEVERRGHLQGPARLLADVLHDPACVRDLLYRVQAALVVRITRVGE